MKKRRKIAIAAAAVLAVLTPLYAWGFAMKTEHYSVESGKIDSGLDVVFISDLHNCWYGDKEQSKLSDAVFEAAPDLVLLGGDLIDQYGGTDYALTLVSELTDSGLVCCYTAGNHEQYRDDEEAFYNELDKLGVYVLNGDSQKFSIDGQKVAVYGILDSLQCIKSRHVTDIFAEQLDDDCYNILLAHRPDEIEDYLDCEGFDLILSGHAHAGQWRIPGILDQGLYAPDQGLFPDYTNGIYQHGDTVHIISRGLARPLRMIFIPRIFNRPELSVISIT